MKKEQLLNMLRRIFPEEYAEDWDNTGLIIDCGGDECGRVLVALELTPEVLDEAEGLGANMIITHHPIIFKPIKKLNRRLAEDRLVMDCIRKDISLYAIHTNCDNYLRGTNDYIAERLGLEETRPLEPSGKNYYKLVVFAPAGSGEAIRNTMGEMGCGNIGLYSHCTFTSGGEGTFKPKEGTNPYIGTVGEVEKVKEVRIETILPYSVLPSVVEAVKEVHPYEEMAYDTVPLANKEAGIGAGRIGKLKKAASMRELLEILKRELSAETLRYTGNEEEIVESIGLCTGSGSEFIRVAFEAGIDCFLTGDIKYHDAQFARINGLSLIDIGHYESENVYRHVLCGILKKELGARGFDCEVFASVEDINPFKFFK